MVTRDQEEQEQPKVETREVEVNLSLVNDKLNYIISILTSR